MCRVLENKAHTLLRKNELATYYKRKYFKKHLKKNKLGQYLQN